MRTLYLRNVPDEVATALESVAARESMSVNAVAVRELAAAARFHANAPALGALPDRSLAVTDLVDAVRSGRDR